MNRLKTSDNDLIKAIRTGGEVRMRALEQIFKNEGKRLSVIRYLKSKGCSQHDAEDLYQDAIIIFERKVSAGEFMQLASIDNYIFSIVKLNWYNKYRKNQRQSGNEITDDLLLERDVSAYYERQERKGIMNQILSLIGERCKKLLLMFTQSYSMEDIAREIGLTDNVHARKEKYRCLNRMRVKVQNDKALASYIKNQLMPRPDEI